VHWIHVESAAYWISFVGAFLACAVWESLRPLRETTATERRWGKHGVILIVCTVATVALYRISPVVMAAHVSESKYGILNKPWLPYVVRCAVAILMLDLVRYLTHRLSHTVGALWRVHQVHHSDPEFDISTALRVHPIEVLFTQGTYLLTVALLAPPLVAVLLAELGSVLQSFFIHANASLPGWLDKPMRAVLVTPNMHRIHHSEEVGEQFKNLSDIFGFWDRLFGTYADAPAAGDAGIVTGLKGFQNEESLGIGFMLAQPFRKNAETAAPESILTGSGS